MLTGELRSKIDGVWNAFWAGGIANPLEVIEQITYLLFMRGLDEAHRGGASGGCVADGGGVLRRQGGRGRGEMGIPHRSRAEAALSGQYLCAAARTQLPA